MTLAADWPQYRGPNHDGVSTDRITKQWSGSVTNPIWLLPVTNSYSSFAISGGRAFTQIRRNIGDVDRDVCVALDANTGAELWATTMEDSSYPDGGAGYDDGPRSTPTVDNGSVYVLTSYLQLYKLDATDGSVIWQLDLRAIYGGDVISWQNAASPLVENGLLYVNANCGVSSLMALRTSDGGQAWASQNEGMTHSTPVLATIQGVRQVIFATQSGLVSLNSLTGAFLWRRNYPFGYNTSLAASPVVYSNMVYICGAQVYNMGSMVVRATLTNGTWTATQLWSSTGFSSQISSHWNTPVAYQGCLFGQFGTGGFDNQNAPFKCVDMTTGAIKWSMPGMFGRGGTLLVNNLLLINTEVGDLVLAEPNTNSYTELARFQAIPNYDDSFNKVWNAPAVADGRVYIRSSSFGALYDLSIPALKMDPPQKAPANTFQLTVRTATGAALDTNRMSTFELRASTNPALAASSWTKLTNTFFLTNGMARVTNVDGSNFPRRFFLVSEPN